MVDEDQTPEPTAEQRRSWESGIQAIFAGFVAVAPLRDIPPNVLYFWETEQQGMVRPSLRSLRSLLLDGQDESSSANKGRDKNENAGPVGVKDGDEERDLQLVLCRVLDDPSNTLTTPKRGDRPQEDVKDMVDREWELTRAGRAMFHPIGRTPISLPVGSPHTPPS